MRSIRRRIFGATILAFLSLIVMGNSLPPGAPNPSTAATAMADPGAQCDVPVAERVGPWVCPPEPDDPALREFEANQDISPLQVGWCSPASANICWHVYGVTHADFMGIDAYGYGSEALGTFNMFLNYNLNGAQSITYQMRIVISGEAINIMLEGERYYLSAAQPGGAPVSGDTYQTYTFASNTPGSANSWPSPGYLAFPPTDVQHGTIWHRLSWNVPGYGSTQWWAVVKSPVFDLTEFSYRFNTEEVNQPALPYNSGAVG